MEMSTFLRSAVLVGLVAITASACATTRAEAPRERPGPPLDVPIPPPRVIAPLPVPEPPPIQPVNNIPGGTAPAPAKPRPPKPAENTTAKPEQKSEEKTAETPAQPNPAPVPQLSIPEAGDTSKLSAETRAMIDRTRAALQKIDYGKLSEPGQKNYNDAKLFADQAEANLKANNFLEAKELAEKAERLAKALQGR
jgi:outer membrane biosynthesis protein TonB